MQLSLVTTNVCLDTAFIESQNFLAGQKIGELFRLAQENQISLHITDITYREVLARFKRNLIEAEEKTKKPRRDLSTAARILRNFYDYNYYYDLPDIIVEDLYRQFKTGLDEELKDAGVVIIPSAHLQIGDTLDDYFANKLPFKEGKKKHEFPDAFTIKAIKDYFIGKQTYLLTFDNDILEITDNIIIPVKESGELIEQFIRSNQNKQQHNIKALAVISEHFSEQEDNVAKQIREQVELGIKDEFNSRSNIGHLKLNGLNYLDLSDIKIEGYAIVHLGEETAKIECDCSFSFILSFNAIDTNEEWFDYTNNIFFPASPQEYYIEYEADLKAVLDVRLNKDIDSAEFILDNVNENKNFEIFEGTIRSRRGE